MIFLKLKIVNVVIRDFLECLLKFVIIVLNVFIGVLFYFKLICGFKNRLI